MAAELSNPAQDESKRFAFGRNWSRYSQLIDQSTIDRAVGSVSDMLDSKNLHGMDLLDIGCGSGLFSLAARRLGARVHSFDFDSDSVATTNRLRERFSPDDPDWSVERGSILDDEFLKKFSPVDIVYSWGVLHHTGYMWKAIDNACRLVKPGGTLFISIYNDQGFASKIWLQVKKAYNSLPTGLRWTVLIPSFIRLRGPWMFKGLLAGRPIKTWTDYKLDRGMSPWYDVIDWVGGYPFEVASTDEIVNFCRERGFTLKRLKSCGNGHGCNEFVLESAAAPQST